MRSRYNWNFCGGVWVNLSSRSLGDTSETTSRMYLHDLAPWKAQRGRKQCEK